jgi:hypothetical protein
MKNNTSHVNNRPHRRSAFSVRSLAIAAVIGICGVAGSAAVYAQATAGKIFGTAPAGETIYAKSVTTGVKRHVQADSKGRYIIGALPVGVYTVTLEKDGNAIEKHPNVGVIVGRGVKVDFTDSVAKE